MALKKELATAFGVAALYHKIESITVEFGAKRLTVDVASFVSHEAREEGKTPIQFGRTLFEDGMQHEDGDFDDRGKPVLKMIENFTALGDDFSRANVYKHLSATPFWVDAENV